MRLFFLYEIPPGPSTTIRRRFPGFTPNKTFFHGGLAEAVTAALKESGANDATRATMNHEVRALAGRPSRVDGKRDWRLGVRLGPNAR